MACEQGNLFGIPGEHQVIFCPNSFSPFAKIHSPHLLSILYACYRHYTIVTFFTQLSSHLFAPHLQCFLCPISSTHNLFPNSTSIFQSLFNKSYSLFQFCSPFSFPLPSSSTTPKFQQIPPTLLLSETYSSLPTIPVQLCLFCIQIKQAPAQHLLGLQEVLKGTA